MYTSTACFFIKARRCARRFEVSTVSMSRLLRELEKEKERTEIVGDNGAVNR